MLKTNVPPCDPARREVRIGLGTRVWIVRYPVDREDLLAGELTGMVLANEITRGQAEGALASAIRNRLG